MPLGAPDVSAVVANALRLNPDAVSLQVVTEDALKVVTGLRQSGYRGAIVGVTSLFPPSSIEALGSMADGIRVTGRVVPVTATQIPEVAKFREQMLAKDPGIRLDDLGLNAWTGMQLFIQVLEGKTVTDGSSVITALDSIETPIHLGTVPDYPGVPATPNNSDYPRVAVFETVQSVITDGKLEQEGDFFNPLAD
jgi:ABC-type branched-subunit amino acid transport system substrate-binding protein